MSSRIYAAEDDDNIREILRCTLESYGYEVEVFESAPPMLERMRRQLPDLVLMDIMMPELDGLEALRRMKESAQTRNVPVIFLTAKSSEVDKVPGAGSGGRGLHHQALWSAGTGGQGPGGTAPAAGGTPAAAAHRR